MLPGAARSSGCQVFRFTAYVPLHSARHRDVVDFSLLFGRRTRREPSCESQWLFLVMPSSLLAVTTRSVHCYSPYSPLARLLEITTNLSCEYLGPGFMCIVKEEPPAVPDAVEDEFEAATGSDSSQTASSRRDLECVGESAPSYECEMCHKVFNTNQRLLQHSVAHGREWNFWCSICGASFPRSEDLLEHGISHVDKQQHRCLICYRSFCNAGILRKHVWCHTAVHKKFEAATGGDSSQRASSRRDLECVGESAPRYECEMCHEVFNTDERLLQHSVAHIRKWKFWCSHCGASFPRNEDLLVHRSTHIDKQQHCCLVCHRSFNHAALLQKHVWCHTEKPTFYCHLCPMVFPVRQQLLDHLHTHDWRVPFACEQCGATFVFEAELTRHKKKHKEVRCHKCPECNKAFLQKSHLAEHRTIHTGERPFSCNICTKKFVRQTRLAVHMRKHGDQTNVQPSDS
ncbi:uncharacterized protein LOC142557074 isoform X1 [Dermacentor variabilis]|uniref:uncharacterized protein LOC142557074 isoform X1 n=2 Tax=Dermacentor variabilis TaxID=34621 RepID=UPI003F5B4E66